MSTKITRIVENQKSNLARGVMLLGAVISLFVAIFESGPDFAIMLCYGMAVFLLISQHLVGRVQREKPIIALCILAISVVLMVLIIYADSPTLTSTPYFFPILIATSVFTVGKGFGLLLYLLLTAFDYAIISQWIINDLQFKQSSPNIFLDRTFSLALIYGISVFWESILKRCLEAVNQMHEKLAKKDKLSALGVFSGGIAHEINNPLAIIGGLNDQIGKYLQDQGAPEKFLSKSNHIGSHVTRIADITKSLLILSSKDPANRYKSRSFAIKPSVLETMEILSEKIHSNQIHIDVDIANGLEGVGSDNFLRTILRIFVENSLDSLIASSQAEKKIRIYAQQGEVISLFIEDNGPGIPDKVLPNIFDPFFTTKDVGAGSGLGLSLVAKLCEVVGWNIDVSSNKELTRFELHIPRLPVE